MFGSAKETRTERLAINSDGCRNRYLSRIEAVPDRRVVRRAVAVNATRVLLAEPNTTTYRRSKNYFSLGGASLDGAFLEVTVVGTFLSVALEVMRAAHLWFAVSLATIVTPHSQVAFDSVPSLKYLNSGITQGYQDVRERTLILGCAGCYARWAVSGHWVLAGTSFN